MMALRASCSPTTTDPDSHQMHLRPRPTQKPKRFSFSSSESDEDSETSEEAEEAVQCPWCGKSFATKEKLSVHEGYHRRHNKTVLKRLKLQKSSNRKRNGGQKSVKSR